MEPPGGQSGNLRPSGGQLMTLKNLVGSSLSLVEVAGIPWKEGGAQSDPARPSQGSMFCIAETYRENNLFQRQMGCKQSEAAHYSFETKSGINFK